MMTEVDAECKPDADRPAPRPGYEASRVLDAAAEGLARSEAEAVAEHRPTGPDALSELELHAVLARGLADAGFVALREVRYPFDPGGRVLPRDRDRCDLVLPPPGFASVFDPVVDRSEREAGAGTLFAEAVDDLARAARPTDACDPAEAAWLEVKTTGTVVYRDGVPTPNRAYADELVRGLLADAIKLADAPGLGPRAAVAVVFGVDAEAIGRDLVAAAHRLLDHGVSTRAPRSRAVPIDDRVGNTAAVIGVFEIDASDPPADR